MARRLPKQKLFRGMLKAGMITHKDIPALDRRLSNLKRANDLKAVFAANRGARFVDKLGALITWLKKHREEILRVLGFIIMFAEDGTPRLVDADSDEARNQKDDQKDSDKVDLIASKFTPNGEPVEDFTDEPETETEVETKAEFEVVKPDIGLTPPTDVPKEIGVDFIKSRPKGQNKFKDDDNSWTKF